MNALRWLLSLIVVAGFVGTLASLNEPVSFQFRDWAVTLPFGLLFFFLFAFACLIALLDRVLQAGAAWDRWHQARRRHKARAIMLRGFGLLAVNDVPAARRAADQVNALWEEQTKDPFRLLFEGRLAEAEGEWSSARTNYEQLGKQKDARLYALRAQLRLAQSMKDDALLRKLSVQALKLAPNDLGLHDIRVQALVAKGEWGKAHAVLKNLAKRDVMASDAANRRRAGLYLEQSARERTAGRFQQAVTLARKAAQILPGPDAAAAEIEALLLAGKDKAAQKSLHVAWERHDDDALLPYWERLSPPVDVFKHYEKMLAANPQSPLTHATLVKAAIEDNKAMEARAHLDALRNIDGEGALYAQSKALVADKLDHDAAEAKNWKTRADALRTTRVLAPQTTAVKPLPRLSQEPF